MWLCWPAMARGTWRATRSTSMAVRTLSSWPSMTTRVKAGRFPVHGLLLDNIGATARIVVMEKKRGNWNGQAQD